MLRMKVDEDDEMMMVWCKQHDRGRYAVIPVTVHYHGHDAYDEDDGDDDMMIRVKGSFCSVGWCQPLLCQRLTPSRPTLALQSYIILMYSALQCSGRVDTGYTMNNCHHHVCAGQHVYAGTGHTCLHSALEKRRMCLQCRQTCSAVHSPSEKVTTQCR